MKDWNGNENSIWKTLGASNHTDKERESDDFYATDPVAVEKLLTATCLYNRVWECACGAGHLSEALRTCGYEVYSTDIRNRGYEHFDGELDFLSAQKAPFEGNFDILTNPPYKYAKEFVKKALELLPYGRRCYMFLKLTFLEGKARYEEIFRHTPPPCGLCFYGTCLMRQKRRVSTYERGWRLGGCIRMVRMAERIYRSNESRVDIDMNGKKCGSAVLTAMQIKQIPIGEFPTVVKRRKLHAFMNGADLNDWIDTLWHNVGIVIAADIAMRVKTREVRA